MRRSVRRSCRLALVLAVTLLTGCGGQPAAAELTVGATPEPESMILAHIYAGALRSSGAVVNVRASADPVAELDSGTLDVTPGLTGRLLATFAPGVAVRSDQQVYRTLVGALPEGIAAGDYTTAAQDKPTLAVTRSTATEWRGTNLTAAQRHCAQLVVGARTASEPPANLGRCRLAEPQRFPDRAAMFAALTAGRVTAVWAATADPDIPDGVVLLSDDKPALVRAENVVPLYRSNGLTEAQRLVLNQVAGVLDTEALVAMRRVVAAGADPQAAADAWLAEHPLGR